MDHASISMLRFRNRLAFLREVQWLDGVFLSAAGAAAMGVLGERSTVWGYISRGVGPFAPIRASG